MLTTVTTRVGAVNTLSQTANYQADPLALYQRLCENTQHNILLESAEIDKKHQLKSLLLVDAALKIVCNGQQVTFSALSLNGHAALEFAEQALTKQAQLTRHKNSLTAQFSPVANELDENSRLTAINPFQALRLFTQLDNKSNHPFAIFLGGVFAFDMIAISEQLPQVAESENNCPDFVYYLAETLVVIDHEKRSSEIIANIFSGKNQQQCTHKNLL